MRGLLTPATISECDATWLEDFSVEKYRPMMRLLSNDDYQFLESQAGYEPAIANQLRAERRRIFRGYLRNLVRDFHRLHLAARMTMTYATNDRSDLAGVLLKQRFTFSVAVLTVEFRLILHTLGFGSVDVASLISSLENLRSDIGQLAASSQAAG
jgi:hypothetical protein